MEDANNVGQKIVENTIRAFVDNPLAGVAVILLIIVLLLGILLIFGLICKGKDESIGDGVAKAALPIMFLFVVFISLVLENFRCFLFSIIVIIVSVLFLRGVDILRNNK